MLRIGGPGASGGLVADVRGNTPAPGYQVLVTQTSPGDGLGSLGHRPSDGLCDLPGPFLEGQIRLVATSLRQRDPTQGDTGDVEGVEVGQPLVVARTPLRGSVEAGVSEPRLDVFADVEVFPLDSPQVTASPLDPGGQSLGPRLISDVGPVGENLKHAAVVEAGRGATDDGFHQAVAGESAFSVDQTLTVRAGRGHDVWRIGDDEVESVISSRIVEGPFPNVHVRMGETAREFGHLKGSWIDVSGNDMVGVARQVQGLHAASTTHVQGAPDMGGNGHLGQGHRCRRDAQHVVGAGFGDDPVQSRGEVGDSPAGGAVVGRTVGTQVDQGADHRPVDAHDSCLGEGLQWQWRELLGGDLLLKQPEPDGPSQRIGATHEGPGGRGGAVSRQSELPGVPDGGHNGVREEADINEGVPQLFDLVGGEVSAHGGNLGAWPHL